MRREILNLIYYRPSRRSRFETERNDVRVTTSERPWRRDPESIRADVLGAALEILSEEGLGTGVERISLDRAVARAGVPRASAYRLWTDHDVPPQAAFQRELLYRLAAQDEGGERNLDTTAAAANAVLAAWPRIPELSPDERWPVLRELIRVASQVNLDTVTVSPLWQAWIGVVGAASSRNLAADDDLRRAILLGEERASTRYVGLYEALAATFGLRPRAPYTYRHFATVSAALVEGLAIRDRASQYTRHIQRATGPGGAMQDWTMFGIAMEAVARQCFESDPDSPSPTPIPLPDD
jgi:AcrR family transcriptional regulator